MEPLGVIGFPFAGQPLHMHAAASATACPASATLSFIVLAMISLLEKWVSASECRLPCSSSMIRSLFSIGLLDRVFPGGVVVAQAALGIMLGGRRAFGRRRARFLTWFLRAGLRLVSLRNRGRATFVFLRHCFLLRK